MPTDAISRIGRLVIMSATVVDDALARLIAAPAGELEVNVAERARCRPEVDAAELASELAVVGVAVANRDLASAFDEAGVSTGLGLWHGRDAGGDGDEGQHELAEEAHTVRW
jgi:hypothetical protein